MVQGVAGSNPVIRPIFPFAISRATVGLSSAEKENGPPSLTGRLRFATAGPAYILAAAAQGFHFFSLSFIHFAAAASASILSTSTNLAMTAMSRLEKLIFCISL